MIEIQWHPSRKDLRVFSALLIVFCAIVAGTVAYRSNDSRWPWVIAGIGLVVGGMGCIWPRAARPVYITWMVATFPIGWTVSHLILAAVYFLAFTPIGFFLRRCKHDPLQRRRDPTKKSYWVTRTRERQAVDYFQQF